MEFKSVDEAYDVMMTYDDESKEWHQAFKYAFEHSAVFKRKLRKGASKFFPEIVPPGGWPTGLHLVHSRKG